MAFLGFVVDARIKLFRGRLLVIQKQMRVVMRNSVDPSICSFAWWVAEELVEPMVTVVNSSEGVEWGNEMEEVAEDVRKEFFSRGV